MDGATYWERRRWISVRRRRLLASALIGGAGFGAIGCSSRQKAPASGAAPTGANTAPQRGGVLNALYAGNPPHYDSQTATATQTHRVSASLMSRLFRFKTAPDPKVYANGDLENDLALSAESADAATWTIKLRADARFSNVPPVSGHPVEAEDVKATFTRFLSLTNNPNRGALGMIDPAEIQTQDHATVVLKLKYPYALLPKLLASPTYAWIFPREALARTYDPARLPIGSGPFLLESGTPDVAYVFKRNPDWFERGRPYVDGVRVAVIPDTSQQQAQFTAGKLDEIAPSVNDVQSMKRENPAAESITLPTGSPGCLYMQLGDPTSPFQDIRLRRAVSMSIDRDAMGKAFFQGDYSVSLFVPRTLGKWAADISDLDPSTAHFYKYNPPEAKQLLDAAGQSHLELKLIYVTGGFSTPAYRSQAEMISSQLNDIGLRCQLVAHDYVKDFIDTGKGSRQGYFDKNALVYGAQTQYTTADEFVFSYFDSKSDSNNDRLSDPKLDAIIDKARTIVNQDQSLAAYKEIQKYVADQMYAILTPAGHAYTMVNARVQDYCPGSAYGYPTETYTKLWLKS